MSASLAVLCLAAFALVAVPVSALVHAGLPWLDRLADRVMPRHRARLWLALGALPSVLGLLAVMTSFLPALGIGHDHCLTHGSHHPHLCPHHLGVAPSLVLFGVAIMVAARVLLVALQVARSIRLSKTTSIALAEACDTYQEACIFASKEPQAFVLGTFRPRIHVSRGLLALGPRIVEPVLAHERVHARRRDLLWRALFPLLALGHLPAGPGVLSRRFAAAQELAADMEAAAKLPEGRVMLAEALLTLAKLARSTTPGLSFTHGDLKTRVRALLDDPRAVSAWPAHLLAISALLVPVSLGAARDLVHHALETLLGVLS